jgi:hypothetical protein
MEPDRREQMPLFMDVNTFDRDVSTDDLVAAYEAELATEGHFGVSYLRYWVSEPAGKVFCLVEADDPDMVVSRHGIPGLSAHEIYPVSERVWHRQDPGPRGPKDPFAEGG